MSIYKDIRIKSIQKKHYKGSVYNFAVEKDESYIANGIAVHNCRCDLLPVVDYSKAKKEVKTKEKKEEPDLLALHKKINKLLEDE